MSLPNYKDNDPRGWCGDPRRGAAMGRNPILNADPTKPIKLVLRKIRIDNGGYDCLGTYFGWGAPLYWYANSEGTLDACLRADNRKEAKAEILRFYPQARFYN